MAQKKNQNKQSGQLARQSQKSSNPNNNNGFAPVASAQKMRSTEPKMNSTKNMTRIIHRELVSTISGNTTFGVNSYSLNPGLSSTFPWLSSVAPSFEQYRFNKLQFHFVTRAPTSYIGSILMAPEYDAMDAAPTSEVLASMMNGAIEDSPWKNQSLVFNTGDMFPMGPRKYIRSGTLPTSSDIKTYDAGQLFLCTVSCADTSAIGKLWVEYDVELHIPQNPGAAALYNVGSLASYGIVGAQSLSTGVAEDVVWNTEFENDIGAVNTSGVITLPAGKYFCSGYIGFSSSSSGGASQLCQLVYYVDGSALTEVLQDVEIANLTGQSLISVPVSFVANLTSSGDIKVTAEMTGAGTLTLRTLCSSLVIQRVG